MLRPAGLSLLACLGLALAADTPGQASDALWVMRPEARQWLPALYAAQDASGLPAALIAELVGIESNFQTIHNKLSTAYGCGQQINGNPWIKRYNLDRSHCDQSIMGASLQFADALHRTGTISGAARLYGTTTRLSPSRRKWIEGRLELAARGVPTPEIVAFPVAKREMASRR